MTRIEKKHGAARSEILDAARKQMAQQGAAALSLRAIARDLGLTAPALYRYFDSRDALVTALIVEAYTSLAVAMETARDLQPAEDWAGQFLATMLAYRAWALAHPQDYTLVFGTPIPGYSGPTEAIVPVATRAFDVFVNILDGAAKAKLLHPTGTYAHPPKSVAQQLAGWRKTYGYSAPTPTLHMSLIAWSRLHGLVLLELFYFIQPFFGDPSDLYRAEAIQLIEQAGLRLRS
jgi:AcrR family transcriptional regulator